MLQKAQAKWGRGEVLKKTGNIWYGLVIIFALVAAQPASANSAVPQKLSTFSLETKTCSFGTELDLAFKKFADQYAIEVEQAGFKYRTPNAEIQEDFERFQPLETGFEDMEVGAISINFDTRSIYFKDDFNALRQKLLQTGIDFPDGVWGPDEGGGIADNTFIMQTGDGVWNEDTRRTELKFSEYGKSRLSCSLPEFERMANRRNMSVEEFAKIEPDPKLWSTDIQQFHEQAIDFQSKGGFYKAILGSGQVLNRLDQSGGSRTIEYVLALDSHARSLAGAGRKREAKVLLERALDLSSELLGAKHLQTTKILIHYSSVASALGDSEQAWWQLHTAYFQYRELFGEKHPDTINALDQLGIVTANIVREGKDQMLDMEEAQRQLSESFVGNRELYGEEDPRTLTSMYNLALIMEASGYSKIAEGGYHEVGLKQLNILGGDHPDFLETTSRLAGIRLRQPQTVPDAHGLMEIVVSGIRSRRENLLTGTIDDAQRDRQSRMFRRYFLQFADTAWLHRDSNLKKRRDEALVALQDAMVGSTDRAVATMAVRKAISTDNAALGSMVAERQILSNEWQDNEQGLTLALAETDQAAAMRRAALRDRQSKIEERVKQIDAELQSGAPEYFDFIKPNALAGKDTQKLLRNDEAILLVVPSANGTHIFAITKNDTRWIRSDWNDAKINEAVRRLLWDVGANVEVSASDSVNWSEEGDGAYPFDRSTAFDLYQNIIAPVSDLLRGKRHVFVATSGALTGLPFGLLVTEQPSGEDGNPEDLRSTKWFADAHALINIPSLQSLQFLRSYRKRDDGEDGGARFLGFGDPVLDGQSERRGGGNAARSRSNTRSASSIFREGVTTSGSAVVDIKALKSLARLPGTAVEIAALSNAFGQESSDIYLGENATEAQFRQLDLLPVNVLAIATHGLLAGELSGNSEPGLVFTPPDIASPSNDGLLTASEISSLDLNADWVILSACNTAAGDGSEGAPGLSGLARSFFFAGAQNLLVSHWPVRDDVAAKITVRTVEISRENLKLSRAEAFQLAVQEIRNDPGADSENDTWAHPNAWAPFTLIGDQ
ncbi:MAG: CHAT domain-containing tetratricopeptide repeat protein [Parasphingorhabdus sp.]